LSRRRRCTNPESVSTSKKNPFLTVSKEDLPGHDLLPTHIRGAIRCARGKARPETSLSILHPPSSIFYGCGVAALCRCRQARTLSRF
jgi:hypothetical protein